MPVQVLSHSLRYDLQIHSCSLLQTLSAEICYSHLPRHHSKTRSDLTYTPLHITSAPPVSTSGHSDVPITQLLTAISWTPAMLTTEAWVPLCCLWDERPDPNTPLNGKIGSINSFNGLRGPFSEKPSFCFMSHYLDFWTHTPLPSSEQNKCCSSRPQKQN